MAIEIIPKDKSKKPISLANIFLFLGIAFLILAAAGYFYLQATIAKASKNLENLEAQILQKLNPETERLDKEIFDWGQKIKDYNVLFASHRAPTNIFGFLEMTTHPKVWWADFNLDLSITNNLKLRGIVQDFTSLQQQLIILEKENFVRKATLSQINMGKEGIEFELEILFNPEILEPKTSI